jgi:phosphosulfolactate synthase
LSSEQSIRVYDTSPPYTLVLDRFSGLIKEEFEEVAKYVNAVQYGWGLPNVWSTEAVKKRTKYYQGFGIKVVMSGTIIEHAIVQSSVDKALDEAAELGFDVVEVSDGIIDMTPKDKATLTSKVKARGFEIIYTVGKKDPAAQPSQRELLSQIEAGMRTEPLKVMIESRERGRGVGIYDSEGNVKWPLLRSITSIFDPGKLVFEAPREEQQAALILELGPNVNLAHVALGSVATLQSGRLGLRFDTFGIDRPREGMTGGPSSKFVLFAIRNFQPIDQKGIAAVTQLPKRTIQKAVEDLLELKLISEHPSFEDRRSKIYRTVTTSPMDRFR